MKRFLIVFFSFLAVLLLVMIGAFAYIRTPAGQRFITKKTNSFLEGKIKTPYKIGSITYSLPDWIRIQDVYLEDEKAQVLFQSKDLYIDISMMDLLRSKIKIDEVELRDAIINVDRLGPKDAFNFQFLVDAFASSDTTLDADNTPSTYTYDLGIVDIRNTQISYKDDFAGIDFKSKIGIAEVEMSEIDIDKNVYGINDILLAGGYAVLNTSVTKYKSANSEGNSPLPAISVVDVNISKFKWRYLGTDLGIRNKINFDEFELTFNELNLAEEKVDINNILFSESQIELEIFAGNAPVSSSDGTPSNWVVNLGELAIKNASIKYDDRSAPMQASGFDPGHIHLKQTNIALENLYYDNDNIEGEITDLSLNDVSQFAILDLKGKFKYATDEIDLNDFKISSNASDLVFSTKIGTKNLLENLTKAAFEININNSKIALSDIALLQPELLKDPVFNSLKTTNVFIDVRAKGAVDNFTVSNLDFKGLINTQISLNGTLKGITDFSKLLADIKINKFETTKGDILLVAAENEMLADYNLPEKLNFFANIAGNGERLELDGKAVTSFGDINIDGLLISLADSNNTKYVGKIATDALRINELFKADYGLGKLSTSLEMETNTKFTNLTSTGDFSAVEYQGYNYQGINFAAVFKDSVLDLDLSSKDPNLLLTTTFNVDLKDSRYPLVGKANISNLNLAKINQAAIADQISGEIDIDMQSVLPDQLLGSVLVDKFNFGKLNVGEFKANFTEGKNENVVAISSPFVDFGLKGDFNYAELGEIVTKEINKYYQIDSLNQEAVPVPHKFDMTLLVKKHPIWEKLVPDLSFVENIVMNASLAGDKLEANMTGRSITYAGTRLENTKLKLDGNGQKLNSQLLIAELASGETSLVGNELAANFERGEIKATYTSTAPKSNDPKHRLSFTATEENGQYKVFLSDLRIENADFTVNDAPLYVSEKGALTTDLIIGRNNQYIKVNADYAHLSANFKDLSIRPFAAAAGYGAYEIKGALSGVVEVEDYMTDYIASLEMGIKSFQVQGVNNGDLNIFIPRLDQNQVSLEGDLMGKETNMTFKGYLGLEGKLPLDFTANIKRLDASLFQQFSKETIKQASGFLAGNLDVSGDSENPVVDGKISFSNFKIKTSYLGSPINVNDQFISFQKQEVKFDNFILTDTLGQKMRLDGNVVWSDLEKIKYDLSLNTKNFQLLDSEKGSNETYYGKANVTADLTISGVGEKPTIGGNVRINETSDVTIIMPPDVENIESESVVTFVPPRDYDENKATLIEQNEEERSAIASYTNEIIVDIQTDPRAQLSVVLDEFSGDNIKVKGEANLTAGIYPSGEMFLLGVYEIASGTYDFSLEFLKRNFKLEPGGTIIWSGDPYQAAIQLKAYYEVNADIQSLLEDSGVSLENYSKVPLDVLLNIDGTIENPLISFDLRPSSKAESSVKSLIQNNDIFASLRKNQSEMNQQVFSLLVFNRFLTDQVVTTSSGLSSQAIARQSVSKLLTEQLNILANDFLGSVGLNFGLNSQALNTTQGEGYRTNLNVGLRKSFLNDRIKVSVGKNFELENTSGIDQNSAQLIDNIEIAYNITPDGRYAVKVYRNNQFQTVLEGFVLETGVSFVLTSDYDQFSELFKKKEVK